MRAIDCQGFAGGFTLGVVNAGFELVSKHEDPSGFGVAICDGNRHLLGDHWTIEMTYPSQWTPNRKIDLVFGNPPCSGFSTLNVSKSRGIDSPVNDWMRYFAMFAGQCAPPFIVMESVQSAFSVGYLLMKELREIVEEESGKKYKIYHVLHSCAAIGGCQLRRRYFLVLSRKKFGIEKPGYTEPYLLRNAIDDLVKQPLKWKATLYATKKISLGYQQRARALSTKVDGHQLHDVPLCGRLCRMLEEVEWPLGWNLGHVIRKALDHDIDMRKYGFAQTTIISHVLRADREGGHSVFRPHMDKPAPVIEGGALSRIINPFLPRPITHREAARIMGFPDRWSCLPAQGKKIGAMWYGKGVTVQCGEWIANWIKKALNNEPGEFVGEPYGERENLINVTNNFIQPKPPEIEERWQ